MNHMDIIIIICVQYGSFVNGWTFSAAAAAAGHVYKITFYLRNVYLLSPVTNKFRRYV